MDNVNVPLRLIDHVMVSPFQGGRIACFCGHFEVSLLFFRILGILLLVWPEKYDVFGKNIKNISKQFLFIYLNVFVKRTACQIKVFVTQRFSWRWNRAFDFNKTAMLKTSFISFRAAQWRMKSMIYHTSFELGNILYSRKISIGWNYWDSCLMLSSSCFYSFSN